MKRSQDAKSFQHLEVGEEDLTKEMEKKEVPVRSKEYQKRIREDIFLGGRKNQVLLSTLFLNLGLKMFSGVSFYHCSVSRCP